MCSSNDSGFNVMGSGKYQGGTIHGPSHATWYNDPAGALAGALGFGPGPSWTPQQEAARNAAVTQARTQNAVNRINDIFSDPSRQAAYDKVQQATTQHYLDELNRQRDTANRRLRFGLASRGLTGGSQAAYDQGLAAQDYLRGEVQAGNKGLSAAEQMKSADEQARENLISLAQAGLDAGTGATRADASIAQNLANAETQGQVGSLGNIFQNLLDQYNAGQKYAEQRALREQAYQTLYNLAPWYTGGS